ncbi:HAD-IA family hydrolase [Nocardia cyriacigeorgica]|nr:HAD-IA family hydrolase [Nocardia cyriacigeorgica]MBF6440292.1 HAD-IA family hydrolase [Nocardia cyriacigeorgica]MBF6457098.1 HAD-IA family hydrolase [Nocardia cyriacigeorgica]MBF6481021.1 HAD-IA family hydrolase [Nocardia cyriacigeorgica]MBF6554241.1 HAD-IA family hydrolase [Nocardia cyriacigeorgica]
MPKPQRRKAILVDFGGVLTTSVAAAFRAFGARIGVDPDLPIRLIVGDPVVRSSCAAFEAGACSDQQFELILAGALIRHGGRVEPDGLLRRIRAELAPDHEMFELVAGLRAAGHPVALVSNSLGRGCFDGYDLDDLVDVVVVSTEVGLRKPSREIFRLACRELGVEPADALLIDDLPHNIDGAGRAGIDGILHGNAGRTAEELATRYGVFPLLPPSPPAANRGWRRPRTRPWMR